MANWFKIHSLQLLIGTVLAILPLIYLIYSGLSWQPLNPHDHFIQNLMAYLFLVLFSYFNHTQFVPRWLLAKKYGHYALVAGSCIISTAYLPHRIEQWFFF